MTPMSEAAAGPMQVGLSVVIPCLNEQDNVEPVFDEIVTELAGYELELLFVDDGSADRTLDVIKRLARADQRVQYVSFTRNFGFEAAFSAGYRYARYPWVLHIDADQQFPAGEARKLIEAAMAGSHDAVFGVRTNRNDPLLRRWGTAAFHFIAGRILRIELPSGATAFRLVRTELARRIVDLGLPTPYFLATVPRLTSRYTTVLVSHRARLRGESKVGFGWLAAHAIELFVGYTRRPAHAAAGAGLVAAGVSALLGLATALGVIGGAAASAALFVLVAVSLAVCSMTIRFLVFIAAGHARPRLFYVREASIPVAEPDLLFGGGPHVKSVLGEGAR